MGRAGWLLEQGGGEALTPGLRLGPGRRWKVLPDVAQGFSLVLRDSEGRHYGVGRRRISAIAQTNLSPELEQD